MDQFAAASGRFSRQEEADEEPEDASSSRREISFMPAAAASSSAAASASTTASASASASAASSSGPCFRSASGDDGAGASGSGGASAAADVAEAVEKEHMFDKVVTPSDVGKLNRLVIPKQYAEKYFPLDAAGNEKGLLLSFEDSAGKHWRFRYSYWNSSQSYVMTKGWSRFVKEKRLVAGDTVSFSRAAAEDAHHRLFIDWKRRVEARGPLRFSGLALPMPLAAHYAGAPHHHYAPWGFGAGGGGGGFFMPPSPPATLYEHHRLRQGLDFRSVTYPAPTVGRQLLFFGASARMPPHAPPQHHPRAPPLPLHYTVQQPSAAGLSAAPRPVLLGSVPVIESPTTASKRVRLFGVNLDNDPQSDGGGEATTTQHQGNALPLQMPAAAGWHQRTPPTLRLLELPRRGRGAAESSAASSPSSSSSSKREARSALDLDL
ncbi:hypothetical protein BS78_04G237600 [Paspalum vaginatum]|nr:hypothetical protein BS78_04G237600 [Paspalum vaginatum]